MHAARRAFAPLRRAHRVTRARLEAALGEMGPRGAPPPRLRSTPALAAQLRRGHVSLRLFTALTTVGTPIDVTAQELRIERCFPAGGAAAGWLRAAARTTIQQRARADHPVVVSPGG